MVKTLVRSVRFTLTSSNIKVMCWLQFQARVHRLAWETTFFSAQVSSFTLREKPRGQSSRFRPSC